MSVHTMRLAAYVGLLFAVAACGPVAKPVKEHRFTVSTAGLEPVRSEQPAIVLRRPGAPTLAAYTRFIIDPVRVNYDDPNIAELSGEDVRRLQNTFRDAVVKELVDGGYTVGTRSDPDTLRIPFTLSGFKASRGGGTANVAAAAAGIAVRLPLGLVAIYTGEVRIEGVFREATTNRIDAIAVSEAKGSRFLKAKPWSTWADVEGAFEQWAEGIREAVDKAHGR